jgi:hypothetical protein
MLPLARVEGRSAEEARAAIETFLKDCRQPALLEPGEELLPLTGDNFCVDVRGERLTLQAWDGTRNLSRRVTGITQASAGRLEISVERFPRREGQLFLVDRAAAPARIWDGGLPAWCSASVSVFSCGASSRSGTWRS